MASKFTGDFGHIGQPFFSFPPPVFQSPPMFPPQEMTVAEALRLSKDDWNEIKQRLGGLNGALTKLLGKSIEKPTLEKILASWSEKRDLLSDQENKNLMIFLRTVDRLEKVKNVIPIGVLLKERPGINAILSKTTVHSNVHEDIVDAVKMGISISSRFKATISIIPRLLDCLCPLIDTTEEHEESNPESKNERNPESENVKSRKRSRSSPSTTQHPNPAKRSSSMGDSTAEMPSKKTGQPGKSNVKEEQPESGRFYFREEVSIEEEFLIGNPDLEFQKMMAVDDVYNMQRKAHFQKIYAKKCAENHQLSKENTALLQLIQENEKEIEDLKKHKVSKTDGLNSGDEKKGARKKQRKDQTEIISDLLKRVESLEKGQSTITTTQKHSPAQEQNQLDEHLKYFHRRLNEYEPPDQTNFIYKSTNFAAGYFDERGGFLEMDQLNVSLFIPPGAIKSGSKSEIYIYVDTDKYPQTCTGRKRTRVAPVVQCGPPGTQFQESVVLSFPHCAEEEDNWKFQPVTCQSDDNHQVSDKWENLTTDDAICIVGNGRTTLMVNHFTGFSLDGEQKDDDTVAKKKMRVGAFGPSYSSEQESYKFRVRAWDDTEAALEQVLKKEERLSGQQLDDDRPIQIASTGKPVDVNVKNVKAGWKNRYNEPNGQEMSFDDLWQPRSLPSCTFNLEVDTAGNHSNSHNNSENGIDHRVKSGFHCQVDLKQQESTESSVKLNIDVHEKSKRDTKSDTFSGAVQEKIFGSSDPTSGLSQKAYYRLCEHLNIENVALLDWRRLAEKLGCDALNIENIKANKKEEPAKLVLKVFFSVWNATKRPGSAIDFLTKTLMELELVAAAKVIINDLAVREMEIN